MTPGWTAFFPRGKKTLFLSLDSGIIIRVMDCEQCGKYPAVIHIPADSDGAVSERHLCRRCAAELGYTEGSPSGLFSQLMEELKGLEDLVTEKELSLTCPVCGTSFRDIRDENRAGCGDCYRIFRPEILRILEENSEETRHCGKVPGLLEEIKAMLFDKPLLEEELEEALEKEEYERAALIRDRLQLLEEKC